MCYTCVRECPAKAIRIANGQAEVIAERCIACGNCVRVCSQRAKQVRSTSMKSERCWPAGESVAACLAPSFPAEFTRAPTIAQVVGMLRALGFAVVHEVAFGADLVAREYRKLLARSQRASLHRHDLPGGRRLRRAVLSGDGRLAGPDRLADDRHGPGAAAAARHGPEGRLHRPVHRQEGRGRRARRSQARSMPCSRFPSFGGCSPNDNIDAGRSSQANSIRRTAQPAGCSPSAADCSRRRASAKT